MASLNASLQIHLNYADYLMYFKYDFIQVNITETVLVILIDYLYLEN